MSADCHVRRLRIRTGDKTILPRMTFLFEDAFRMASFSGIPPNGRVFIKRLYLGNSRSSVSSRVLAAKIDEALRRIRPVMISPSMQEDISAPAVWFPDDLSPHRFLLDLLSKNHQPRAWYWQTAIKGWRPDLTRRQSYQLILTRAAEHETGIRGLSFVLEPLFEDGKLLDVLDILEPRQVSRILIGMGLPAFQEMKRRAPPVFEKTLSFSPLPVSVGDAEMVTQSAGRWTLFDPRFMLLAYLILSRMNEKADPFQVNRLLETVSNLPPIAGNIRNPQPALGSTATKPAHTPLNGMREETEKTTDDGKVLSRPISWKTEPDASEKGNDEKPVAGGKAGQEKPVKAMRDEIENVGGISQAQKITQAAEPPVASGPAPPGNWNLSKRNRSAHTLTDMWPRYGGFAGDLSEHAGLIFIIPLMKRIGMDTLMEDFPAYEDLDLPWRILFRCAELLGISADDPVLEFLGEKPEPSHVIPEFTAPPEWRRILLQSASGGHAFRMGRIRGMPGYRLIFAPKGRLVIGLWHPGNRARIKFWIDQARKRMGIAASRTWSMDRLVDTMVTAMNRYCRQYAAMGLGGLIRRPAYIATTKTHLDVTFPFSQLDIRVRMAGLDINPGWVPWLGRVFQFHYVGGEG